MGFFFAKKLKTQKNVKKRGLFYPKMGQNLVSLTMKWCFLQIFFLFFFLRIYRTFLKIAYIPAHIGIKLCEKNINFTEYHSTKYDFKKNLSFF